MRRICQKNSISRSGTGHAHQLYDCKLRFASSLAFVEPQSFMRKYSSIPLVDLLAMSLKSRHTSVAIQTWRDLSPTHAIYIEDDIGNMCIN
jgi:hypothetical protein